MKMYTQNAETLQREFDWFQHVLEVRFELYFKNQSNYASLNEMEAPNLEGDTSNYAKTIKLLRFGYEERLVILLALAPSVNPSLLDLFFTKNQVIDRPFTEFGGVQGSSHSGFLPTAETALFLLAGNDLEKRFQAQSLLAPSHPLQAQKIINLDNKTTSGSHFSGALTINPRFLRLWTTGEPE